MNRIFIVVILFLTGCSKIDVPDIDRKNQVDSIGDYKVDTTFLNCQLLIFTSYTTYRNGVPFQSFDLKKTIGEPCSYENKPQP